MIVFDLIMTGFEDLLISYFITSLYSDNKDILKMVLITAICIIETVIFSNIYVNNLLLYFILIFTYSIYMTVLNKKFVSSLIIVPCLILAILAISNVGSFFIVSILSGIDIDKIYLCENYKIFAILISRIFFLISIIGMKIIIKKYNLKILDFLLAYKEKSLIPFILNIYAILITISEVIIYGYLNTNTFNLLVVEFILLCFFSCLLFIEMYITHINDLKMQTELLKEEYSKKLYYEMSQQLYSFSQEKHDLFYFLTQIEMLAEVNGQKEIEDMIKTRKNRIIDYNVLNNTDNPIYDNMINKCIKELRFSGWDVVYFANMSKNEKLEDMLLISNIETYLNELFNIRTSNKRLEISINEKTNYIIFHMKVNIKYDFLKLDSLKLSNHIKKLDVKQTAKGTVIKILIK